eukprot:2024690-Pleurochrysis_carterae.AAC.1
MAVSVSGFMAFNKPHQLFVPRSALRPRLRVRSWSPAQGIGLGSEVLGARHGGSAKLCVRVQGAGNK